MVEGGLVEFKDKSPNPKTGLKHDNAYMYLGKAKMKHPESRAWIDAAIYSDYKEPDKVYVREWNDFIEKFEEHKEFPPLC